jgi:hypothetical protein
MISKYTFERTELRVLQEMCKGDNEEFLNAVAELIGRRDEKIKKLEDQINSLSWINNPDRMGGGGFSAEELDPNRY